MPDSSFLTHVESIKMVRNYIIVFKYRNPIMFASSIYSLVSYNDVLCAINCYSRRCFGFKLMFYTPHIALMVFI